MRFRDSKPLSSKPVPTEKPSTKPRTVGHGVITDTTLFPCRCLFLYTYVFGQIDLALPGCTVLGRYKHGIKNFSSWHCTGAGGRILNYTPRCVLAGFA